MRRGSDKLKRKLDEIQDFAEKLPDDAYRQFKKVTPVDTGNARRRTDLSQDTIEADYPYANRLNNGWSRQAPNGMTEPTIKYIKRRVLRTLRG